MAGVTRSQWPPYMKEIYRILKPGNGWVQCGEFDPRLHCDDGSVPKDAAIWKVEILSFEANGRLNSLRGTYLPKLGMSF